MTEQYNTIFSKLTFLSKKLQTIDNMEIKQLEKDKMRKEEINKFGSYGDKSVDVTKITNTEERREEAKRLFDSQPDIIEKQKIKSKTPKKTPEESKKSLKEFNEYVRNLKSKNIKGDDSVLDDNEAKNFGASLKYTGLNEIELDNDDLKELYTLWKNIYDIERKKYGTILSESNVKTLTKRIKESFKYSFNENNPDFIENAKKEEKLKKQLEYQEEQLKEIDEKKKQQE